EMFWVRSSKCRELLRGVWGSRRRRKQIRMGRQISFIDGPILVSMVAWSWFWRGSRCAGCVVSFGVLGCPWGGPLSGGWFVYPNEPCRDGNVEYHEDVEWCMCDQAAESAI